MWQTFFGTVTLAAALRMASPLLLSAIGGSFNNRAGTLNIAHEAFMLVGAFFAAYGSYLTSNPYVGALMAMGAGLLMSVIYGLFVFHAGGHPMVISIAMNLGASGFSAMMLYVLFKTRGSLVSPRIESFPRIDIPLLKDIPFLGDFLSGQIILVYLAIAVGIVAYIVMYKTPYGLHIRAIGMNAKAAQTAGINVMRYKWSANLISGLLDGLAGAFLPLCGLSMFTEDMTSGRGFLAVAAILIGQGNPARVAIPCFVFGYATALTISLQNMGIASQIIELLPYLATVLVLIISSLKYLNIRPRKKKKLQATER